MEKTNNQIELDNSFVNIYGNNSKHPILILFKLYKGNYGRFALAILFFIIKHSPVWILPIITSNIINIATYPEGHTEKDILINVLVIIALIIFNFPMNYLYTKCQSSAIRQVEANLRSALIRKLQQLSISYHKEMESGRLQSKIIRDVEAIETLSSQIFTSLLTIGLNIIVALSITLTKSMTVFVFFILTVPVAGITIAMFRRSIRKRNREFRREMENTSARVMEMVELIPVTRAHALENEEIKKMESQLNEVASKGYRLDIVQANFAAVSWCLFQAFQVICLAFTGFLAFKKRILVGDIAMYQSYFTTIVNMVSNLITMLPNIAKGTESITSVGEVLLAHDVENYKGKKKLKNVIGDFKFINTSFAYEDGKEILSDLNFKVNHGETIALVGESGAGKTTILNLVIGFNKPTGGMVTLDGYDMNDLNLRTYRQHLAVVPQATILFSGSIRDNITYGLNSYTEEQLNAAVKAANLSSFIESLPEGLDTMIGEHGGKLSGGQRQRLSIARALIRQPKVIILDEATSALDSNSEREIQTALDNLVSDRTTFVVAHRLSTIRNADKIAVIGNGGCIEFGSYDELMEKKGAFYQMRKLQME
ncbi:MAG: ABC transporter ATP-binding protein/permease [Lachnospiraceae bacterium]|nr:ABC transporter ATP-binding protein/permease [Lachnospiraceae bacterium]